MTDDQIETLITKWEHVLDWLSNYDSSGHKTDQGGDDD